MNNSCWFETDDLLNTTRKNIEKIVRVILPNVSLYCLIIFHHWEQLLQHYEDWKFSHGKKLHVKSKTNVYTSVLLYRVGFIMKTGNKNAIVVVEDLTLSQQPMSSPLVFDSVKIKSYFPPMNDSNSFGTVDYRAQINANIDDSINHVFKSISIQELNTLHNICDLERTQLLKYQQCLLKILN